MLLKRHKKLQWNKLGKIWFDPRRADSSIQTRIWEWKFTSKIIKFLNHAKIDSCTFSFILNCDQLSYSGIRSKNFNMDLCSPWSFIKVPIFRKLKILSWAGLSALQGLTLTFWDSLYIRIFYTLQYKETLK